MAKDNKLELAVSVKDEYSKGLKDVQARLSEVSDAAKSANSKIAASMAGVKKAFADAGKGLDKIKSGFLGLAKNVGIAAGAVVGVGAGVYKAVSDFAKMGDVIQKTSKSLNMSVESFQRLTFAAERSGASQQTLVSSLKRLNTSMFEAASGSKEYEKTFASLGVNVTGADGKLKSHEEMLMELANAYQTASDKQAFIGAASKVLGRNVLELIPLFEQGAAGIKALGDEAAQYGIMSAALAQASEAFVDAQTNLNKVLGGLVVVVMEDLVPIITQYLVKVKEWILANKQLISAKIQEWVAKFANELPKIVNTAKSIVSFITEWVEKMGGLDNAIKAVTAALGTMLAMNVAGNIAQIASGFMTLKTAIMSAHAAMAGMNITASLAGAKGAVVALAGAIKSALLPVIAVVGTFIATYLGAGKILEKLGLVEVAPSLRDIATAADYAASKLRDMLGLSDASKAEAKLEKLGSDINATFSQMGEVGRSSTLEMGNAIVQIAERQGVAVQYVLSQYQSGLGGARAEFGALTEDAMNAAIKIQTMKNLFGENVGGTRAQLEANLSGVANLLTSLQLQTGATTQQIAQALAMAAASGANTTAQAAANVKQYLQGYGLEFATLSQAMQAQVNSTISQLYTTTSTGSVAVVDNVKSAVSETNNQIVGTSSQVIAKLREMGLTLSDATITQSGEKFVATIKNVGTAAQQSAAETKQSFAQMGEDILTTASVIQAEGAGAFETLFGTGQYAAFAEELISKLGLAADAIKKSFTEKGNETVAALSGIIDSWLSTLSSTINSWTNGVVADIIYSIEAMAQVLSGTVDAILQRIRQAQADMANIEVDINTSAPEGKYYGGIAGFASGGIVPGVRSNKDNVVAALASGEGIINNAAMSKLGNSFVHDLNLTGRLSPENWAKVAPTSAGSRVIVQFGSGTDAPIGDFEEEDAQRLLKILRSITRQTSGRRYPWMK